MVLLAKELYEFTRFNLLTLRFQAGHVPSYVTSLTYGQNGDVITGDSRGQITVWSRSESSDAFQINKLASEHLRNAHKVCCSLNTFISLNDDQFIFAVSVMRSNSYSILMPSITQRVSIIHIISTCLSVCPPVFLLG